MRGLFFYELKKLCNVKTVIIFICLMLLKLCTLFIYAPGEYDFNTEFYRSYTELLYGEPTADKEQYILSEKTRLDGIWDRKTEMDELYRNDDITLDEYIEFNNEYSAALGQIGAFAKIYDKYEYFKTLNGKTPWYFYDLDTADFLCKYGTDILFVLFLVIFGLRFWDYDRLCGCLLSVAAQPIDKVKLVRIKCSVLLTVALIGGVLSFGTDIIIFCQRCGISALSMPICSMEEFAGCEYNVTVLGYMLSVFFIRTVWSMVLCVMLCLIHKLLANMYACVAISAAVILLPMTLYSQLPEPLCTILIGSQLTGSAIACTELPQSIIAAVVTVILFATAIWLLERKKSPQK